MASISLSEHDEKIIREQLESGRYGTASEVVQAALQLMADIETSEEDWLREKIPSRLADFQADPSIGVPLETVAARLEARHRARTAKTAGDE